MDMSALVLYYVQCEVIACFVDRLGYGVSTSLSADWDLVLCLMSHTFPALDRKLYFKGFF